MALLGFGRSSKCVVELCSCLRLDVMGLRAWRNAHGGHTALGRADVRKGSGTVGDHRSKRCDFIA